MIRLLDSRLFFSYVCRNMGVNRINKRKQKKGCGCKMCKPHKGKYAHQMKDKYRSLLKSA